MYKTSLVLIEIKASLKSLHSIRLLTREQKYKNESERNKLPIIRTLSNPDSLVAQLGRITWESTVLETGYSVAIVGMRWQVMHSSIFSIKDTEHMRQFILRSREKVNF